MTSRIPHFALTALLGCSAPAPAPSDGEGLWVVQVRRSSWRPRDVDYVLQLEATAEGWTGLAAADSVFVGRRASPASDVSLETHRLAFTLTEPATRSSFAFDGTRRGRVADGRMTWHDGNREQVEAWVAHHREVARFDADASDARLPRAEDPTSVGVTPVLLDRLILGAEEARSDALIVLADGHVVAERHFGAAPRARTLQSITKAASSLAIGMLLDDGRIPSVDAPLALWFPELASDARHAITLRHVLTHTSGLDPGDTMALNESEDQSAYALSAALTEPPGTAFDYNNRAFQLLSAVIQHAAERNVEAVLRRRVFDPLGMRDAHWSQDGRGRSPTYGGLDLRAIDLAVLGQMLANGGRWNGEQVVPLDWVEAMATPTVAAAPQMGLGWFLRRHPADADAPPLGFGHSGSGGQYLHVYPEAGLVVVRMVSIRSDSRFDPSHEPRRGMPDFGQMADALAIDRMAQRSGTIAPATRDP